jgi:MFS family permease
MIGLGLLLVGTAIMIAVVGHYGTRLAPWDLIVPIVLYGAGLGLGASSLMLITIGGAAGADAGGASGLVNTVIQLGTAAGPATIGTLFFSRLASGGFLDATRVSLMLGVGLFAVALLACLLLPRPVAAPSKPTEALATLRPAE